ncbi:MAG: hypothetical protein DRP56_01385 [Planctomycetota bacterium]|nr:MAG: hypothetical protein DRP56_01385 [Planctomycetota bacterium]
MKLAKLSLLALLVLCFSVSLYAQEDSAAETVIIDPNVAILAASEYLPCYYPGDWAVFDYEVCYDLDGIPAAYVVIFRDPNAVISDPNQLTDSLKQKHAAVRNLKDQEKELKRMIGFSKEQKDKSQQQLRKQLNMQKRGLYHTDGFATVITGATEDSAIVYRCYVGLPGYMAKKKQLQLWLGQKNPDKGLQMDRLIFISPVDIEYEILPPGQVKKRGKMRMEQISDEAMLLLFSTDQPELKSATVEKQKKQQKALQKQQRMQDMPEEYRQKMQEAELNRKRHNAGKWRKYSDQLNQDHENLN